MEFFRNTIWIFILYCDLLNEKKIIILGSTGSIGSTTLKIIDKKKSSFKVILLSAKDNYSLICKQIQKYKPKYFVITNSSVFIK